MVQFVRDRVFEFRRRLLGIEIKEDRGIRLGLEHKTVRLGFDYRENLGLDDSLLRQVSQVAACRSDEVGLPSRIERFPQRRSLSSQLRRQHKLLEIFVGKIAVQAGLALFQADIRFRRK